ncbi:MAG: DUF1549 domain-containing protein [Planctomycetota bacterium]
MGTARQFSAIWGLSACCLLAVPLADSKAAPASDYVAVQVDRAITQEVFDESTDVAPLCDDETFLRRAYLDIVGDIPTPEESIAFLLDPTADKRARLVDRLLDDPHYGQNWARYWRDVVFYRAQEDRARIAANAMVADLATQLNESEGWDQIASDFITARGDVREDGHTAIIMAQDGRTEETTAEISRIFLGIQIQCAQCHDHPYDRWKREQFHELAAFFPRIGVRAVREVTKRSFEVYASDRFTNRQRRADNDRRPSSEHRMPNLDRPELPGDLMKPKFFLTSASLPYALTDDERREQLSEWLTGSEWFSIALVNRMWAELVGEPFYPSIDDIGPDREPTAPTAMKLLAKKFAESGHDVKWLISTICNTEAYQRQARPRRGPTGTSFAANVPQRLRSDQLFNVFYTALGAVEEVGRYSGYGGRGRSGPRDEFAALFGYDPSEPREGISATIPQSLALMNGDQLNRYINPRKPNALRKLLADIDDNESLIVELYLRCFSREPTDDELARVMAYCDEVGKRSEAFEDVLWALVNSAEFQHRR